MVHEERSTEATVTEEGRAAEPGTVDEAGNLGDVRQPFDTIEVKATRANVLGSLFGRELEPVRIGRFVVLGPLGSGAMGRVYLGFDPELDRKLAIKVIKTDEGGAAAHRRERLVREAKALARLSHPNVVGVYEVGTMDNDVFVAMEYVEGASLRAWLAEGQHDWHEVVDVMGQAGRGLAAAHAAGMVHRDFKPENVLLGVDGRVRVVDFGLARALGASVDPDGEESPSASLTRTGVVLGTPAYMPPEQFEGQAVDARSDQFSFCVVLFEALYGLRPFPGQSYVSIVANIIERKPVEIPGGLRVPPWLHRATMLGLEAEPDNRHASMDRLLAELGRDPQAWRRRALWLGLAAATGLAGIGLWSAYASGAERMCAGGTDHVARVWGENRRAGARNAFDRFGSDHAYAADAWRHVEAGMDSYMDDWNAMHRDACEATHVRREQSEHVLDLRMECLRRRLAEVDAVAQVLLEVNDKVAEKSVELVTGLPPLGGCANVQTLLASIQPPKDQLTAERVDAQRAQLALAKAREEAGRGEEGLIEASAVSEAAERIGYAPLVAETLAALGSLHDTMGDYAAAENALSEAYWLAAELGHDEVASDTAQDLVTVVGLHRARHQEALGWVRHSFAAARRGQLGALAEADIHYALGTVLRELGRHEEALVQYREAESAWTTELGSSHPNLGLVWGNVGVVLDEQGEFEAAQNQYQQALELFEAEFGPKHPKVGVMLNNLGASYFAQGRLELAISHFERSLPIWREAYGLEHPRLAVTLFNIAGALDQLGRYQDSLETFQRTLEIREAAFGTEHPVVAASLVGVGAGLMRLGRYEDAISELERATSIHEHVYGPDHARVADPLVVLGVAFVRLRRHEEAAEAIGRGLRIRERTLGPEHPHLAEPLANLGATLTVLGRFADARAYLERALAIRERVVGPDHPLTAHVIEALGDLARRRGRHERALSRYREALVIHQRARGGKPAGHANALLGIGRAQLALGHPKDAVEPLERAVRASERDPGDATRMAVARFALARALWPSSPDRPRARALAEQALARYREEGSTAAADQRAVERWLASHR